MAEFVRQDFEAPLVRWEAGGRSRFAKELPIATAWHFFSGPDELVDAGDPVIAAVTTGPEEIRIEYAEGISPLDLGSLRRMVRPSGPLAVWRTVHLFSGLIDQLMVLHRCGICQQLLHPERLARLDGKLVLLPTFAGVVPPLGVVLGDPALSQWIYYAAPEVLRDRALSRAEPASDFFSLGRLLSTVCQIDELAPPEDPSSFAEALVESSDGSDVMDVAQPCLDLRPLIERLCHRAPGGRPGLAEVRDELNTLGERNDPLVVMERFLDSGNRAAAEALRTDLLDAKRQGIGEAVDFALGVIIGDLELMKEPPDVEKAVQLYDQAEGPEYRKFPTQLRMARAYARFGQKPDYAKASRCYRYSFGLRLKYPTDPDEREESEKDKPEALGGITGKETAETAPGDGYSRGHDSVLTKLVDEWGGVLGKVSDLEEVVESSSIVPMAFRAPRLIQPRLRAKLALARPTEAWMELVGYFRARGFTAEEDTEIYRLGIEIAHGLEPSFLMKWMAPHRKDDAFAVLRSIVWQRCGNQRNADEDWRKAIGHHSTPDFAP